MRHYFGYDINGTLRSVEQYGPQGWPTTARLDDPNCGEPAVVSLREKAAVRAPDIVDWILYDCPCDPGQGIRLRDCQCANETYGASYVDINTKTLKSKPLRTVYLNDQVINNRDIITKPPGTKLILKIAAAGIPDEEVVHCLQRGQVDLTPEDKWDLTFKNGVTDTATLVAPAQGTKGVFSISGRLIRPLVACIRGFDDS